MGRCCSAFGHADFYSDVHAVLHQTISELVSTQGVTLFLTGGMGDFDALFCRTVREVRAQNKQIQLVLVIPYFSNELKDVHKGVSKKFKLPDTISKLYDLKDKNWKSFKSDYRGFRGLEGLAG